MRQRPKRHSGHSQQFSNDIGFQRCLEIGQCQIKQVPVFISRSAAVLMEGMVAAQIQQSAAFNSSTNRETEPILVVHVGIAHQQCTDAASL